MIDVPLDQFEVLVSEALDTIPAGLAELMDNVAVFVPPSGGRIVVGGVRRRRWGQQSSFGWWCIDGFFLNDALICTLLDGALLSSLLGGVLMCSLLCHRPWYIGGNISR